MEYINRVIKMFVEQQEMKTQQVMYGLKCNQF